MDVAYIILQKSMLNIMVTDDLATEGIDTFFQLCQVLHQLSFTHTNIRHWISKLHDMLREPMYPFEIFSSTKTY